MWENFKTVYATVSIFLIFNFIYVFAFLPVTRFVVKKMVSLEVSRVIKETLHASSPIISFCFFFILSLFLFLTGVDWERDWQFTRSHAKKSKQNKIHKLQINELGVLMTTQRTNWEKRLHLYHVIIFLCFMIVSYCVFLFLFFFFFFFMEVFWKSEHTALFAGLTKIFHYRLL